MPRFEYTPVITLGGILQILTIIGGVGSAYVVMAQKDIQHDERLNFQDQELKRIEKRVDIQTVDTKRELEEMNHNLVSLNEKISNYIIHDLETRAHKDNNAQSISR